MFDLSITPVLASNIILAYVLMMYYFGSHTFYFFSVPVKIVSLKLRCNWEIQLTTVMSTMTVVGRNMASKYVV